MAATTMNLASSVQLEMVDQLRVLGISNFVALPQVKYQSGIYLKSWLTVNGKACRSRRSIKVRLLLIRDFSSNIRSGKSSVLESFSEIPFPRDSGLCTRFATQITFRRTSTSSIKVSIIPGPDRNRQEAERLRSYVKEDLASLTPDAFLKILAEVCCPVQIIARDIS